MESGTLRTIQLSYKILNLQNSGFTNVVSIYLYEEIQELIEYESSGMVTNLGSHRSPFGTNSHIFLNPRSLTRFDPSQVPFDQEVPYGRFLGQRIAQIINESLANDTYLRQPVFVTVEVNFIKERRLRVFFPPSWLSRGASAEVLQRLVEEQRVESVDLKEEDETCSICVEHLSDSHENIIRMPDCLHMFHQNCLFEWLGRQNSCPLCRKVAYE